MESVVLAASLFVVVGMLVALVKGYDTRTVLLGAGFIMAIISGKPMLAFTAFSDRMVYGGFIEPILSVMGFAYIMKYTRCDAHLVHFLVGSLQKVKFLLLPGATLVTAFVNITLTSAAGVSAAVGAILIPMLISAGVRPALAAAAIYGGTLGSVLSPGSSHNVFVATKLVGVPVMDVVGVISLPTLTAIFISAATLTLYGVLTKESRGYVADDNLVTKVEHSNPFYAILPVLPIALLIVASTGSLREVYPWLKQIRISHCMLVGSILGIVVTRTSPSKAVEQFFRGTGDAYASILGIIIAAAVFVGGLKACGATAAFIDVLKDAGPAARWFVALGPFFLALSTGSAAAITLAFNEAVTPHAAVFGMSVMNMGCLAHLISDIGRICSPLAAGAVVCAGLANVPPIEVVKRTSLGMIIAAVASIILLV